MLLPTRQTEQSLNAPAGGPSSVSSDAAPEVEGHGGSLRSAGTFALVDPSPLDTDEGSMSDALSIAELGQRVAELEVRLDVAESERWHARAVLSSLPSPVVVTNPFEDVVLLSAAAARLFGVEPGSGGYGPLAELCHNTDFVTAVAEVRSLHRRGARRTLRTRMTDPAGRTADYDITLLCVCDQNDGRPSPWGVVVLLEEILPEVLDRQAAISAAQAEATAAVAHELRTPLASIRAYTELLLDGDVDHDLAARRDFLKVIASESDRLARLVDNMQLLARIESGQARPRLESISPAAVVNDAMAVIGPQALSRGLQLSHDLPTTSVPCLLADRDLLQQALLNTLANAVKYTPPGGSVRVSLAHLDPEDPYSGLSGGPGIVEITIADTGVGIPPKDLPFVFDKFFRARAHASSVPGSGLGLPLVKAIVETVHGGSLHVESRPNEGTRVVLRLPLPLSPH